MSLDHSASSQLDRFLRQMLKSNWRMQRHFVAVVCGKNKPYWDQWQRKEDRSRLSPSYCDQTLPKRTLGTQDGGLYVPR